MNHGSTMVKTPRIQTQTATVFFAPTDGRRFLTLRAAANKEAGAMMRKKYPAESPEHDTGYGGFHWTQDERLVRIQKRLARFIYSRALKARAAAEAQP